MQAPRNRNLVKGDVSRSASEPLKYQQLADHFMAQIRSGQLAPGTQLPTFAQMNQQHDVSRSTVEKMLLILEREQLIERQNGNGIFVAQGRRRSTQGIIGLSGEGFNFGEYSSYWSQIMGGAREASAREKTQLLILDPHSTHGWEKVDGVLVCDWTSPRDSHSQIADLPVVSLMTPVEGMASAIADDENGTYIATRRLLELGHRKIAYMHGYDCSTTTRRLAGYSRALQEAGIEQSPNWTRYLQGKYYVGARFSIEARRNMLQWLREDWSTLGCTALLCHNDEAAIGAIQAFAEFGISVPQDVNVVGFDGTEFCDLVSPSLSSVGVPLREIGAAGVELLLKQIKADAVSDEHRVLPVQWQERNSTSAPKNRKKQINETLS